MHSRVLAAIGLTVAVVGCATTNVYDFQLSHEGRIYGSYWRAGSSERHVMHCAPSATPDKLDCTDVTVVMRGAPSAEPTQRVYPASGTPESGPAVQPRVVPGPSALRIISFDDSEGIDSTIANLKEWVGLRVAVVQRSGAVAEGTLQGVSNKRRGGGGRTLTLGMDGKDWTVSVLEVLSVERLD